MTPTFIAPGAAAAPPRRHDLLLALALCPAIAVTDTFVDAAGLGLLTVLAGLCTAAGLRTLQRWLVPELRLAAVVLISAATIVALELAMSAWIHDLRQSLGIFASVLAVNALLVLATTASADSTPPRIREVVRMCLIMCAVLLTLGAARELVGRGSLLHNAAQLFGPISPLGEFNAFRVDMGFLLAMLPPGAFIALGLLLGAINWFTARRTQQ